MDRSGEILAEVESLLGASEYEVVDVTVAGESRGLTVRVLLDREGGLTVDDCTRVSRALGDHFEAHGTFAGRYVLEVSSPGVDRPVRKAADFARFAGERIKITTYERIDGRTRHDGILSGFEAERDAVVVEREGIFLEIPRTAIRRARLVRDPWIEAKRRSGAGQDPRGRRGNG